MSLRRMLPFIVINIIVSASVVLLILYWWNGRQPATTIVSQATATAVSPNAPLSTPEPDIPPTETPEPTPDQVLHVVKGGDTLGNIATIYQVTIEDIMAANGMTDPNFLTVGEELIIPVGGLPTATPIPTETPVSNIPPTPIPTEPPAEGVVILSIDQVLGVGQLDAEQVRITNSGGAQVSLLGWELFDADGYVYTFGQFILFGDGASITIHTKEGQNTPTDLYWGRNAAVWRTGETVSLRDSEGTVQVTFKIP